MKAALQPTPSLVQTYGDVRAHSEALARPLSAEDCLLQSMPDASPVKWHLAHTSWFFETVILAARPGYRPFDPRFAYRVAGEGLVPSDAFALPVGRDNLAVDATILEFE